MPDYPTAAAKAQLWADYSLRQNRRVPFLFSVDEAVWTQVAGSSFKRFYLDPQEHLRVQLEGLAWMAEQLPGDQAGGLPDRWTVGVRDWMEENTAFGCQVIYQEDDYAWGLPLSLGQDALLGHLTDLDMEDQVRRHPSLRLWEGLCELTDGLTFRDRPVEVAPPLFGTHGLFTKAAELRGLEQLCLDLVDAPAFAEEYLRLFTEKTLERMRAWHRVTLGTEPDWPNPYGYGFADDSLQLLSPALYQQFVLPCHEHFYKALTTGARSMHLCGYAEQHFEALRWQLGITLLDGPGPFVHHAKWLARLGPDFAFNAQVDHSVLMEGTPSQVREHVRQLLAPGAKLPGRFQVLGYLVRQTPLANAWACYEAGLDFGSCEEAPL